MKLMALDDSGKSRPLLKPVISTISPALNSPTDTSWPGSYHPRFPSGTLSGDSRDHGGLLKMPGKRFVHFPAGFWKETELEGVVTILFLRFLLNHLARSRLHNRGRNNRAVLKEELRHSQFSSNDPQRLFHFLPSSSYSLISTSMPAAKSSFIRASTVCWVGSRISRRRLWVRISNCSLDFLST